MTCIGYGGEDFPKREDVFPVGWAKRGPTGTIPTNRADSHAVAEQVSPAQARDPKSGPMCCRSLSMPRAGIASTSPRSRPAPL